MKKGRERRETYKNIDFSVLKINDAISSYKNTVDSLTGKITCKTLIEALEKNGFVANFCILGFNKTFFNFRLYNKQGVRQPSMTTYYIEVNIDDDEVVFGSFLIYAGDPPSSFFHSLLKWMNCIFVNISLKIYLNKTHLRTIIANISSYQFKKVYNT